MGETKFKSKRYRNDKGWQNDNLDKLGMYVAPLIEPLIHDIADRSWLAAARQACDRSGAVLIFDEIKTAFRIRTGGVQELLGVIPDLTTLGKAMANGYPLAAVVGRHDVMQGALRSWISSTAAAETTGLAAAKAVFDWHERVDVTERLALAGGMMQEIIGTALSEAPWVGVRAEGPAPMWRLVADVPEQLDALVAAAARNGVLLKRGAYQFAAIAHGRGVCIKATNYGVPYHFSRQEAIHFASELMKREAPDIVIFLDGLNDFAWKSSVHAEPYFTTFLTNLIPKGSDPSGVERPAVAGIVKVATHSALIQYARRKLQPMPAEPSGLALSNEEIVQVVDNYKRTQGFIAALCIEYKITCFQFLQPVAVKDYIAPEGETLTAAFRQDAPLSKFYRDGYQRLVDSQLQPAAQPMHVAIVKPRHHAPTFQINHLRVRPDECLHVRIGANLQNPPLPDRNGLRLWQRLVHRPDLAIDKSMIRTNGRFGDD